MNDAAHNLRLTLLGVGGAFDADKGVANTGALLEILQEGEVQTRILIDCGHTCGRQLIKRELTYEDIDAILITHAHGDHIDGLEVVGYKSRFLYNRRVELLSRPAVLDQIWQSLFPKMGRLQLASDHSVEASMDDYFNPTPVAEDEPIPLAGGLLSVRFIPVHHVHGMPAYALLFSLGEGGPCVRWSGDTTFDADSPLFQGVGEGDMIFHDCIFYPYYEATVHTHHVSLCTLPEEVRRKTVLVHHGIIEETPERREQMHLGQPFDVYTFPIPS